MSARTPSKPAPRWSKRIDLLVHEVAGSCRPALQSELGRWMQCSARFEALVDANQTKLRKKLTTASSEDARLDVRAEMLVAYLLLDDRRFEVALETFTARQAAPDLAVTYRGNVQFTLEVTRLRTADEPYNSADRLASVIGRKVRQLPAATSNALVIVGNGLTWAESSLPAASRMLRMHVEGKDDAYFARHGLHDAREFSKLYQQLAGVCVLDESATRNRVMFWVNRDARRPVPHDAAKRVLTCLAGAGESARA
jgi:hypothetical protein